jgi:hypothetical protein
MLDIYSGCPFEEDQTNSFLGEIEACLHSLTVAIGKGTKFHIYSISK